MAEDEKASEGLGDQSLDTARDILQSNPGTWLKMEFEQGFVHLRDREDKIIELTKLYITTVLGSGSIAIALLGRENLSFRLPLVGMLLIASCFLGEMIFMSVTAYRIYFVTCARQLNAIRRFYSSSMPRRGIDCVIQPTDPAYPPMFHPTSAHFMVLLLMAFLNATLAFLGGLGLTSSSSRLGDCRLAMAAIVSVLFLVLNLVWVVRRLKGGDSHAR